MQFMRARLEASKPIRIYEVGPRDGIQNLFKVIDLDKRQQLIEYLALAGIKNIEIGSMANPKKLPTMADSHLLLENLNEKGIDANFSLLVMNARGMYLAKQSGVEYVNVVISPQEMFNRMNFVKDMHEMMMIYEDILYDLDRSKVRVYISCAFGDGFTDEEWNECITWAAAMGDTVVLADTDGSVNNRKLHKYIKMAQKAGVKNVALHFHLTFKKSQKTIEKYLDTAYHLGVTEFDSSIAGLGGCPYVINSGANLSTESLVSWAIKNGIEVEGVNLRQLARATRYARKITSDSKISRILPVHNWSDARVLIHSLWA
jgi:hydroxymethylglutaryl-CoA lyase